MIDGTLNYIWNTVSNLVKQKEEDMEKLNVGIKRKKSRKNDPNAAEADEQFNKMRRTVLIKSGSMCQGCKAPTTATANAPQGYFEIHHKDDDHHHNDEKNLLFVCPFCHMVFTCGKHGKDFEAPKDDSAHLLWLPGIPQNTLNLLAHLIFQLRYSVGRKELMRIKDHPAAWLTPEAVQEAEKLEKAIIETGTNNVAAIFGKRKDGSTVQCHHFYDMLKGLDTNTYEERLNTFSGVRLWPKYEKFMPMTEYLSRSGKLLKSVPMGIFQK